MLKQDEKPILSFKVAEDGVELIVPEGSYYTEGDDVMVPMNDDMLKFLLGSMTKYAVTQMPVAGRPC